MMNCPSWVQQSCLNLNLSRLIVLAITKVNILTKSHVFVDVLITVFHDVDVFTHAKAQSLIDRMQVTRSINCFSYQIVVDLNFC